MLKTLMVLLIIGLSAGAASAIDRTETIYIRAGQLMPIDSLAPLPIKSFSRSAEGPVEVSRLVLTIQTGDRLNLVIVNQDDAAHEIRWTFNSEPSIVLAPGASDTLALAPTESGVYPFMDAADYPFNAARGLTGAVIAKDAADNAPDFVWFLNEHDADWLPALANGEAVNPASYSPDYFTINGLSFPASQSDPLGTVVGQTHQPLNIWVINGGLWAHSLHFHGYHADLLSRNGAAYPAGLSKDTVPIKPGEGIHLRLTPHQPGMFPVHDHALTTATAKGAYPNGMMAMLHIEGGH